ncbi:MAG: tetratricopeptide (TPR) repeat protein [Crocinitomicaceae bacterium]|jgi:tetratricopeptide (TPR) repeat protein
MNLFKKNPIIGIVIAFVMIGAIFLMRSAGDKMNAETTVANGQKFYKAGNYNEAIKYFDNALNMDSTNYAGYFSRGLCYKAQNKFKRALADYNNAIRLSRESDKKTLYYTRGEIKSHLDLVDGACKDMKEASKRGDDRAAQYLNLFCE